MRKCFVERPVQANCYELTFSQKGVVSLVAKIIANYSGNVRRVASGRAASETLASF
jgi:hypothetical protein